ncbi:unnamed protein product [Victoria cruziana]
MYKCAFQHLSLLDGEYEYLPSPEELDHASELCEFLKPFYDATNLSSMSRSMIAHVEFDKIEIIRTHLYKTSYASNEYIVRLVHKMISKFEKYIVEYNILFFITTILDQKLKL